MGQVIIWAIIQYLCQYLSIPSWCNYDTTSRADDYQIEKKYYASWFTKMGWMRQIYIRGILFFTKNTIFPIFFLSAVNI